MAKQTFTTGQVLTAAQMTSLQQTAMLGGNATAKTISYTLVAADAGTTVAMSNAGATTITVNTSLFAAGDIVTIYNQGAGVCTITAGTATVNTSGSLVLAQYQGGVLYFISASAAVFFQFATPASGDIEGVTAGVGISGGGTSGTVTVTNSMATAIDAKGDLIAGTGADTFDRLAVGTNDQVLIADSSTATGLKWGTPSGGGWTLLSTTSLSGASVTVSSISQSYKNLLIIVRGATLDGNGKILIQSNESSSLSRCGYWDNASGTNQIANNGAVNVDNQSSGQVHAATVLIYNYTNTSYSKLGTSVFNYGSNNPSAFSIGGYAYSSTSAISSIKIAHNNVGGAVFGAGQVLIYGEN